MAAGKQAKKGPIASGLQGCHDCCYSMDRKEWGKLVACYAVFYSFLAAWFAVHLHIMVTLLPDTATLIRRGSNGLLLEMGEPNYIGFQTNSMTLANEYKSGEKPSGAPWTKEAPLPATKLSSTGFKAVLQQIRVNNNWRFANGIPKDYTVKVTCTPVATAGVDNPLEFSGATNPFYAADYTASTTVNGTTIEYGANGKDITVSWGEAAKVPLIVQYEMKLPQANEVKLDGKSITVKCKSKGTGKEEWDDAPDFTVNIKK